MQTDTGVIVHPKQRDLGFGTNWWKRRRSFLNQCKLSSAFLLFYLHQPFLVVSSKKKKKLSLWQFIHFASIWGYIVNVLVV
jgi:hypothetical protein